MSTRARPKPKAGGAGFEWDRFALYELCAQAPERDARMLRAIHGAEPTVLGEDFCGTAALSAAWVGLVPGARAVGVDHDAETIERAKRRQKPGMTLVRADVLKERSRVDVIAVQNFSINEWHTRERLVRYFAHARSRLKPGGCLVCDVYDGSDAFLTGTIRQSVTPPPTPSPLSTPKGTKIAYFWEHRTADPLTGRVVCAMHFEVRHPRGDVERWDDAFVYDWRHWSVPELRDAMREAGFARTEVYPRTADALDGDGNLYAAPVEDALELGDSFNVYVVGRRKPQ